MLFFLQGTYPTNYNQTYGPPPTQGATAANTYMPPHPPSFPAGTYGGPPSWMPPPPNQMGPGMAGYGPPGPMPPFPPPPGPPIRNIRPQTEEY